MCSTAPGGYSTDSINISLPGMSARSFCMTGVTIGCGAVCAKAAPKGRAATISEQRMRFIDPSFDWAAVSSRRLRAAEPFVEADGAEAGAIARRQRSVVQLGSEVAPVHVSDHLALVAARGHEFARELVHRTGFRARNLDGAVQRRRERQLGQVGNHIVRGNRLE